MNKEDSLYIFKFKPILKNKVWGGHKLADIYGKGDASKAGESWELSGVKENVSIVSNGRLKGMSLTKLIEKFRTQLVGDKVYDHFGKEFPLLFKFIDAEQDLSVQLHPNNELAAARHNSFGKSEMWYILDAEENARLILGFNREMNEQIYTKYLFNNRLTEILHSEKVNRGDAFYLKPGTVHAIGEGILLAEIQQTSDVTYRIYDWDRPDSNGELRELHTDLALEAIDYNASDARLNYNDTESVVTNICKSEYFETNKIKLSEAFIRDISHLKSFVVYMCIGGTATLTSSNTSEEIKNGDTVLIPASFDEVYFETKNAIFLEVYVP
tara:strand:- start:163191 stop:164168 length:978 start_codon:yes stop_codon:yes gene_type:complete